MQSIRLSAPAALAPLGAILIWSGNTIVTKAASASIDPATITFARWLLAFVLLLPWTAAGLWRSRAVVRVHWRRLAMLGGLGMVTYQGLAYEAARTASATDMGIIQALMPLMAVLLATVLAAEGLSARRLAGVLLSLAGVIYMATQGNPALLLESRSSIGDGLMLIAVLANALYGVLLRRWSIPLPTWQQLQVQIAFATLITLPFWLAGPMTPISTVNAPLVLYAGSFASLAAPFCWLTAVRHYGAARSSLFMNLLPPMVALLAWTLLGETLHVFHAVGGIVVLLGVWLAVQKR
jgi:drug/metabolite transporter (DMT)-like permease